MSVCEKCGTKFEPQAGGQVVTMRVLCPVCAAARAAEKMKAKATAGVSARPASEVLARPAAPKATPVPASRPLPKPPARPAADDEDDDEAADAEADRVHRAALNARRRESRTTLIAGIVAGVFAIAAGVVVTVIVKKNIHIREVAEDEAADQKRIIDQVQMLSAKNTKQDAEELIQFAAVEEPNWKEKDNATEIVTLVAKAKNLIERERVRADVIKTMADLESELGSLEQRAPEEIADLRRRLIEIEPRVDNMGADFIAKIGKARIDLNRAYVQVLHQDAKAYAEANPEQARLALQRYTKAEDEIITLFDEASKARNRDVTDFYRGHFQDVIKESDELVTKTYTDEAIEKLPWKELLTGEQATFWNAAAIQGFSHRLEDGVMTMVGPDANANGLGMISIGDREQWRDFVVDLEFTLDNGRFDLYLRLGNRADGTVPMVKFMAEDGGLVAGKTYTVTVKMIGSALETAYYPEDKQEEPLDSHWTMSRKGALGFVLTDGTRLKITRLRVKELRASGK